jgi:hypothetical protein
MDKRSGISSEAVAENLKCTVDAEIPLDERAITTSINRGSPLLLSDKGQPAAKSIFSILRSIKERVLVDVMDDEEEIEAEGTGLFSR